MRVKFNFRWGTELDPEVVLRVNEIVTPQVELDDEGKMRGFVPYEADLERLLAVLPTPDSIELHGAADPRPLQDIADQVAALNRRLDRTSTEPMTYVNHRIDVHVPGFALLGVDEVAIQEDFCTEALQDMLDEGWRILAICPQPDQRRPDYVLGRKKRES